MTTGTNIPLKIHQTWKTDTVPDKWAISPAKWQEFHPTWEYKLWTDADNRSLVQTYFPDFLSVYDLLPYNIQRADAVRYCILYVHGGVYSDLDIYPLKAIDDYIQTGVSVDAIFVVSGNVTSCLTNSFMASAPGATVWLKCISAIKTFCFPRILRLSKHFEVMMSTGPIMLNGVVHSSQLSTYGMFPKEKFMPCAVDNFCFNSSTAVLAPLEGKSWCGADSIILNFINRYKWELVVAVILSIVAVIVIAIVYVYKYQKCKRRGVACAISKCNKGGGGGKR